MLSIQLSVHLVLVLDLECAFLGLDVAALGLIFGEATAEAFEGMGEDGLAFAPTIFGRWKKRQRDLCKDVFIVLQGPHLPCKRV